MAMNHAFFPATINCRNAAVSALFAVVLIFSGCGSDELSPKFTGAEAQMPVELYSEVMEGTVSSLAGLEGGGDQIVRGYGLVVGLAGQGSSEVPSSIRKRLIQQMGRIGLGDRSTGTRHLSPDRLIDDLDTAVVVVSAAIAPGTPAGESFDVEVSAIPGSQTLSLDGGVLYSTDLQSFTISGNDVKESLPVAEARGDIFVNPFIDPDDMADAAKLRRGTVPGGGFLKKSRKIALVLARPDYGQANMLQKEINGRFPSFPKTAIAKNQAMIEINVPNKWRRDYAHFLELLTHLYVRRGGAFLDMKMRSLVDDIVKPDAPKEDIALIWEAMGKQVLPIISPLYLHEDEGVRFYAARTGARLEDMTAIDIIIEMSETPGKFQLAAIGELGRCGTIDAIDALKKCFDSSDDLVRIAAFEAMSRIGPVGGVKYARVAKDFNLYAIPSSSRPMIYATRSADQAIVVFSSDLRLRTPLFFSSPDDLVTINSGNDGINVDMYRRVGSQQRLSEVLTSSADLWSVISRLAGEPKPDNSGKVKGLGLSYSQVVSVLYRLCEGEMPNRKIPAEFVLQKPSIRATISNTRPMEGRSN